MLTIKSRAKRSKIWKLEDEKFIELVATSKSMKDVLNYFGLQNKGNNFHIVKKRVSELNLETSHFLSRIDASNLTRELSKEDFIKNWLVENSERNRYNLKLYLVKFELVDYKCVKCSNDGSWLGEQLSLQLEHINGISNDNRLENLCFLCPNCHTQTSSYAGKKNKKITLCDCGEKKHKLSTSCNKCRGPKREKIIWPSSEELKSLLWSKPTTKIAKELGVSDKAVEKHIKKLGLTKPPRGYWG
jgi:hypothetical protein